MEVIYAPGPHRKVGMGCMPYGSVWPILEARMKASQTGAPLFIDLEMPFDLDWTKRLGLRG